MTCQSGKQGYATAQEAAKVKRVLLDRTGRHSAAARKNWSPGRLVHYKCPFCGEWHVGHALPSTKGAA